MFELVARLEIAMYTLIGCAGLLVDEIKSYSSKSPRDCWPELTKRATEVQDDGHAKIIRALIHGEEYCREFE